MNIVKVFLRFAKKNLLNLGLIVLITFLLNYIRSLVPLFISRAVAALNNEASTLPSYIERIFENRAVETQILFVFIGIIITCAIREIVNIGSDVLISYTSETIGFKIQTGFYDRVQQLPYSYLNRAETGDLIQRATNDVNRVKRFCGQMFPEILGNVVKIIIYSVQMLIIDYRIALVEIGFVPLILLVAVLYFKRMQPIFTTFEELEGAYSTVIQENLTGIRVVKAFANEDLEIKKQRGVIGRFTSKWKKMMNSMTTYWASGEVFGYGMLLVGFVLGILAINQGRLGLSGVTSIIFYIEYIMWPTRQLGRQISEMGRTDIAASRISEIINKKTEFEISDGTLESPIKGHIVFDNVSFTFEDASIPCLKNINFEIKEGQTVAIVGKTGSGKSTLVSLLNRMLEPTKGSIYLDGHNILEYNKKYLRKNVGVVLQEPFLFSKTIASNIGISKNEFDLAKIKEVSEIASVKNDIENFEQGYDTIVGERGVTLSGGQKQRISIARMILDPKPILVFDDSLSAVDTETDKKIRKALSSRQKESTTIIITHRIITAKDADVILVMDDGVITNIGTHEELIKQEGLYKTIWDVQNYFEEVGE